MIDSRINNSWPFAKEGLPFIAISLIITLLLLYFHMIIPFVVMGFITLFVAYFFRDPDRNVTYEPNVIVCPADGKILKIEQMDKNHSPTNESTIKVSIFMSIFDVHVNRIPTDGSVEEIVYKPGKYFSANLDKASEQNERNSLFLKIPGDRQMVLVQIAGLIARRIACWIKPGDIVKVGQRFGLIRFGSRVELFLPPETEIYVKPGQKVKAGITKLGCLK